MMLRDAPLFPSTETDMATKPTPVFTAAVFLTACILVSAGPANAQKSFDQPPQVTSPPPASNDTRNPRFTLINDSNQIIDNLNISPVADDSWGEDLLGRLALPPHNRIIAGPTQETGCTFDVRVVYHDKREEVIRRQNLCKLDDLTFTGRNARLPKARSQSDE